MIAKLAVSSANYAIDLPYSYRVPDDMRHIIQPGMRALVPFGNGNRICEGIVLSLSDEPQKGRLKQVHTLLDQRPVFQEESLRLAIWMREQYFCTVYDAAMTMLPTGLKYTFQRGYELTDGMSFEQASELVTSPTQLEIIRKAQEQGGCICREDLKDLADTASHFRKLEKCGVLRKTFQVRRNVRDKTEKIASLAVPPEEALSTVRKTQKKAPMRVTIIETLRDLGDMGTKELQYFTGASSAQVKALVKLGLIQLKEQEVYRYALPPVGETQPLGTLSAQQEEVFHGLSDLLDAEAAQAALLYGVTGSGKTQVYLHLIQRTLSEGKSAIVMVPEISLTPGLLRIFLAHFGSEVAVLHSYLSAGNRYDEWKRIRDGHAHVVVGTRSAVFAPLSNLGLIILDEEQESSYQSESGVRYHARQIAKYRCSRNHSLLLLGSATPAVESRYSAETGNYHLFQLTARYNDRPMPEVLIADMKQELRRGNASGLSLPLKEELEENLRRGEQSILLLNRRGNSRMAMCTDCGAVPNCPNCSVSLTYHSVNGRLMCHYCGWSEHLPGECPTCSGRFQFVGIGTQKIQQELEKLYPEAEVLRMDADTTTAVGSHEAMLDRFRRKNIPILLGTQMVAKGLDFAGVTLVGVIDADLSLNSDSYRASERTFSLLTQVVGRAGRGEKAGRAVLQTWTPDNDIIRTAARQDYDHFYEQECLLRRQLQFPPYTDIFRISCSGENETGVYRVSQNLKDTLTEWCQIRTNQHAPVLYDILGPAPAPILKVNNRYRYRLTVRCKNTKEIRLLIAQLIRSAQQEAGNRGVHVYVDVNPMD